jgi:hypothetical protein
MKTGAHPDSWPGAKRPLMRAVALLVLAVHWCAAEPIKGPQVFGLPPGALASAKARAISGDHEIQPALERLIEEADHALKAKPVSVIDKTKAPPSGDKHDYMSTAPYFWPDPSKANGLPYIRRDGFRNPESHNAASDSPRMGKMANTAHTLALAYYLSGKEEYAAQAAKVMRVWFLDPATRMNPNFKFAQAIPGVNTGRGTGMIESRSLISVMDAAGLLAGSTNWAKFEQGGLRKWMADFLEWAQTSKNGKDEKAAKNNHGTFYDLQMAHLALFTGQKELAARIVESAKTNRIAAQIKPDGSQPFELSRADSFGYSRFNLQALFDLATLGEHVGVDLWHFESTEGASIKKGLDFLLPYAQDPNKAWPLERQKRGNRDLGSLLRPAWLVYHDERYLKLLRESRDYAREQSALFSSLSSK